MADVIIVIATIGFFAAAAGYVTLCERIIRGGAVEGARDRE